jgi:hypothetical protein
MRSTKGRLFDSSLFAAGLVLLAPGCWRSDGGSVRSPSEAAAQACVGVPESDRQRPPFLRSSGIEGVRAYMGERRYIKFSEPELRGAEIIVRATAGATKQWVARVVRCHVAYCTMFAPTAADLEDDPLLVGDPNVSFDETETGFVVRIAGHDRAEGKEILRRATRLTETLNSSSSAR